MASFDMNISSAIVLLLIAVLAFLAVRRMVRRGLCDSGGPCDGCSCDSAKGGCSACSAVDKMVVDMECAAKGK